MTVNHDETSICPNCKAKIEVEFSFWNPSEDDDETEEVECDCGCTYDLKCELQEVEYSFYVRDPSNVVLPDNEVDENAPYVSKDPNQLSLC